jgi:D-threonate/D-erythronate kinase
LIEAVLFVSLGHDFPSFTLIMRSPIPEIAVIADDLTGSLDTGLQFRKKGLTSIVPLVSNRSLPGSQVLVINTNSRNLPGDLACRRVYRICRRLDAHAFYKKIDSTMRGNIGREALAILRARKIPKAVVVPTIPVLGRTVERAILRVHGVPLLQTSYARDPFHPLWTSRVPDLLRRETGEPVGHLGLSQVRKGPSNLAEKIESSPARLLSLDAVIQSDLEIIASACRLMPGRVLACGSVGLADELGPLSQAKKESGRRPFAGPILIVSASRNPATGEQIRVALDRSGFPLLQPDLDNLTAPRNTAREIESISRRLGEILPSRQGAVLATTFESHLPGKETAIPRLLGKAVFDLLGRVRLGGLVLTGGDLAMGVCERLSSSALRIENEVLPGIPCSSLIDGPFQGLRTVTKAGGFGEKDALWRIIQYLRGEDE